MKYFLFLIIGLPIRLFAYLFPRNNKLIIYGGSRDLIIDNVKYQFIINNETMPNYRHIWLTRKQDVINYMINHNMQAVKANSLYGMFMMLRAGFVIFDDGIDYFSYSNLAEGSIRINLWHGIPAKMIGSSNKDEEYKICNTRTLKDRLLCSHIKGDYCICPSKTLVRYFSYSFRITPQNMLICGYPRTRFFFMNEFEQKEYLEKYETESFCNTYNSIKNLRGKKVIYMPTFRDKDKEYLSKAIPDWEKLNRACKAAGTTLFIKVHRVTPVPRNVGLSNIKILDNTMDIYPLLTLFDLLITDYSSIMFDFSLLNKKILLYTYDIKQYRLQSRPLYDFFDELLKSLSYVENFYDFMKAMDIENSSIKSFPSDLFFDDPGNFGLVKAFIEKLS